MVCSVIASVMSRSVVGARGTRFARRVVVANVVSGRIVNACILD
jgi:hypothetical protein